MTIRCGDWPMSDIARRWSAAIARELASFVWPLTSLDEVRRLLRSKEIRLQDVCAFEFTAAVRERNELVHGVPTMSIDLRPSLVPGGCALTSTTTFGRAMKTLTAARVARWWRDAAASSVIRMEAAASRTSSSTTAHTSPSSTPAFWTASPRPSGARCPCSAPSCCPSRPGGRLSFMLLALSTNHQSVNCHFSSRAANRNPQPTAKPKHPWCSSATAYQPRMVNGTRVPRRGN